YATLDAEVLRHSGAAEVAFDQEHAQSALGERDGKVCCCRGLALLRYGGGDHDRPRRVVDVDELQVRPELAEGLRPGRPRVCLDDEGTFGGIGIESDSPEQRGAQGLLHELWVLDRGVER